MKLMMSASISRSALASKVGEIFRQQVGDSPSPALEEVHRLVQEMESRQSELEREIERLRKTQRHLEAYRDRYIGLYDFAPLGYVTLDDDGYVQEINLAGATLLGVERDAIIGYALGDYVANDDQQAFLDHVRQCAGKRRKVTSELRLVAKSGQCIVAQFHSIPVEGPTDETLCKTAITDITERRRAEESLEEERNLLRTLIDNLPDSIYVKDAQSRFLAANLAAAQIMGAATPNDLLGKTDSDFYPPELAAEYHADEEELLRSGQPLVNKDEPHELRGDPRTVLTTKVPLKDHRGRVVGLVGISRDITERKKAEASLLWEKSFTDAIINSLPGVFYLFDNQGRFLRWNRHFEEVSGYSAAEIATLHPLDFFRDGDRQLIAERIQEVFTKGASSAEADLVSKNGTVTPYFFTGNLLIFDQMPCIVGMGVDISQPEQAEDWLRQAKTDTEKAKSRHGAGTGIRRIE